MGRFNPFKAAKKVVKTVTKPIAKVLDKVVPNELKPYLPYAAAVAPFMLPGGGIASLPFSSNPAVQRALLSGTIQLGSQLAQEGSEGDFDVLPLALATASGYLSTPGATEGLQTSQQAAGAQLDKLSAAGADIDAISAASETLAAPRSLLTQAKDIGITGLQKAGEFMSAPVVEGGPGIFSMAGVKAASVPVTGQTIQDAVNFAKEQDALYKAELAEFNRLAGEEQEASDADRRSAITASMLRANFTQDVIDETLDQLGLLLKDGGRVGYQAGGRASLQDFQNALQSVSAGTTYDQQRQAKEFARNEANRMLTEAFKSGTANQLADQFGLQNLKFDRGSSAFGRSGPIIGLDQRNRQGILDAMTAQMLNYPVAGGSSQPKKSPLQLKIERNQQIFRDYVDDIGGPVGMVDPMTGQPQKPFYEQQALLDQLTPLTFEELMGGETFETLSDLDQYNMAQIFSQFEPQRRNPAFTPAPGTSEGIDIFNRRFGIKDGGIASFKDGGIMDLGGKEMDMRGGGFIPIGAKERADDVPARLSKNEFVMTADAVRAAGGGSVNKGAKRMYDLMHKLEARA